MNQSSQSTSSFKGSAEQAGAARPVLLRSLQEEHGREDKIWAAIALSALALLVLSICA